MTADDEMEKTNLRRLRLAAGRMYRDGQYALSIVVDQAVEELACYRGEIPPEVISYDDVR